MRNLQTLDRALLDADLHTFRLIDSRDDDDQPLLALRREGEYVIVAASYGALEIALRLRFAELTRTLTHLAAGEGTAAPRQIGSAQAYLGLGLRTDGALILRPTLVADATGLLCINFMATAEARQALFQWLGL